MLSETLIRSDQSGVDAREVIEAVRSNLGAPPRHFGFFDRRYLWSRRPKWLPDSDDLMEFYRKQDLLLQDGLVVWGALVQANALLFEPGPYDHPAMVLYVPGRSLDACPKWLESLARDVFRLKNTTPENPDQRRLANMLTDEMERGLGWIVPAGMSGGHSVSSTTLMVIRRHLPGKVLRSGLFPLLTHPDTPTAMIVPSKFWPRA